MCDFRLTRTAAILALILILPKLAADDLVIVHSTSLVQDVAGNLNVRNGASVSARNIHVSGNVQIEGGASFYGQGVRIDGNLRAEHAGNVALKKHEVVKFGVVPTIRASKSKASRRARP